MTMIIKKAIPLAASLLLLATHGLAAATYAHHRTPSSIHTDNSRHYCLTGDGENDCGFTSLPQCEATASGGLGVCNMVP
ncbi:DUF3551 domain-containing protein [Bradyrhizobium cenepequi]|uniref:DUF3551 domain-containing protein n=1 Tax=Bradyrhizobium cenepequi TaxID=2821403 RepID=UPI001CE339D3|nr:DUF3551 domain-containing protein [Bradyrhizobium cenepequi]MCA6111177.1 DUF3551 domain-containing protein [Bradyrhizobium cenepequi]